MNTENANSGSSSGVCQKLAELVDRAIRDEVLRPETVEKVSVIAIDGPTAAGKTILADGLAERLRTSGRECWVYRLDWTLVPREDRVRDLENLRTRDVAFAYEAERHMRLDIAGQFLESVATFNEAIETGSAEPKTVGIENLYARDDGGTATGTAECPLVPGLVVLVEGHYSLRSKLDSLIDYNIVLLADADELLARKVARVKGYRDADQAENYFYRIDLPSFRHHLARFGCNADMIIDNTDVNAPKIRDNTYLASWSESTGEPTGTADSNIGVDGLLDRVFSPSILVGARVLQATERALQTILDWDNSVGQYLRLNVDAVENDLSACAAVGVATLNDEFKGQRIVVEIGHTNAFHNVFHRTLPLSLGLKILDQDNNEAINLLANVHHDHLLLQVISAAGYRRFRLDRELGAVTADSMPVIHEVTPSFVPLKPGGGRLTVWTPTTFTAPEFLEDVDVDFVFTGHEDENISAGEALCRLVDGGGVWIHRFPMFSDINFFVDILRSSGAEAIKVGNYVIALWSNDPKLRASFKKFRNQWTGRISDRAATASDEADYDSIINRERQAFQHYIRDHCPDFTCLDGYLFCTRINQRGGAWARIVGQLADMLGHDTRLVRKRAVQFILKNFPNLSLGVSDLWHDAAPGARDSIGLEQLSSISPSILAEVYLWIALRNEKSAILGANIYDIRASSIDCRAHLQASMDKGAPIVLQSSFNALGQAEEDDGKLHQGYLKPLDGSDDLVRAALNAARDIVLSDGRVPPLFGIGLDHVDAGHDIPKGRAKRFLQAALRSQQVTHYVPDGSALFDAKGRSGEELKAAYGKVADYAVELQEGGDSGYIFDHEICVGELNYVGDQAQAMIPTANEMALFTSTYRQKIRDAKLGAQNVRPTLFIGNLGTTHHNFDAGDSPVETSLEWRDRIKRDNFVSAVLHGTTQSHPDILARATVGCHKVNVAGDFLHTMVQGLPVVLRKRVESGDKGEPKTRLADIRADMDELSEADKERLIDSVQARSRSIMDTINAPELSELDREYFRYKLYKFSDHHIDVIIDTLLGWRADETRNAHMGPSDPRLGYEFSPSMIEVTFDDHYKDMVAMLWDEGLRHFHVDVGDGKFIPRRIDGLEKVDYLRKTFPDAILHAHLMIENPHHLHGAEKSPLVEYIDAGCAAIAVHEKAFTRREEFFSAIRAIRDKGARPGVIIETSQNVGQNLWNDLKREGIDWVVVMGVPIGFGGQIFDMASAQRISTLYHYARADDRPFLIEVDGGLTMENLSLCRTAGAQIFSGWSIIRGDTVDDVRNNLNNVRRIISRG